MLDHISLNAVAGVISAIIGGAGVIAMFRFLNGSIKGKQDSTACNAIQASFKEQFEKGDKKFDTIMEKLEILPAIKTDIEWLKDKNGGD